MGEENKKQSNKDEEKYIISYGDKVLLRIDKLRKRGLLDNNENIYNLSQRHFESLNRNTDQQNSNKLRKGLFPIQISNIFNKTWKIVVIVLTAIIAILPTISGFMTETKKEELLGWIFKFLNHNP